MKKNIIILIVIWFFMHLIADSKKNFEYLDENLRILYQHEITDSKNSQESALDTALKNRRQRKENIIEQYWDLINEEWRYFTETKYIYDDEGTLVKTILFNFEEKYKVQSGLDELTYDDEGRLIKILQKRDFDLDKNVRLKNFKKFHYEYDSRGNIREEILQIWDKYNWKNEKLKKYSYNFNNIIREIREFKWKNRDWEIETKTKYEYYNQDQLELVIHEEFFQGQVFSTQITDHEYNEEGQLSESLTKSGVMGQWKIKEFSSCQYDKKGNLTQKLMRDLVKRNWINKTAYLYVYDKRNSISKIFEKIWSEDQIWQNFKKTEYYYKLVK